MMSRNDRNVHKVYLCNSTRQSLMSSLGIMPHVGVIGGHFGYFAGSGILIVLLPMPEGRFAKNADLSVLSSVLETSTPLNSSSPSAAYMRRWSGPTLAQVMACRLFGVKQLPEPMLVYCQLDCWEQISLTFDSEFYHFRSRKCIWNCRLPKWQPFCPGRDELKPNGARGTTALHRVPNKAVQTV